MKKTVLTLVSCLAIPAVAQVFNPGNLPPPTNSSNPPPPSSGPPKQQGGGGQWLGNDVPFLDPGSETATWNGHAWNITNNRLFRGRFEKYLATPEDDSVADREYRRLMNSAIQALTPKKGDLPNLSEAVGFLQVAAEFPIDARQCDAIASAIYTVWMVQKNERAMEAANRALQKEIENLSMRVEIGAQSKSIGDTRPGGSAGGGGGGTGTNTTRNQTRQNNPPTGGSGGGGNNSGGSLSRDVTEFTRLGIDMKKIMEREALRVANQAKAGLNEIKAKIEFQALIIQLFLQRRFEHSLIACRAYNYMFSGQDRELQIKQGSDVEKMFAKGLGVNPTISTLEVFANDAIRDVDEGVQAFEYLVEKDELQTASNRLMEAFAIGEYMPRVRTLVRDKKLRVLEFVRDSNMLISSLEMRDLGRAEELLVKIKGKSTDFDESKPRGMIESAKNASNMHIQSAQLAAVNQDQKRVEEEITKAATLWPTNPALGEFSKMVSQEGNAQVRILSDFEQLLAQRNYRQIAKDAVKYGAVMLNKPDKEKQLREVLEIVKRSETALIKADELARSKNVHGAWESVREAMQELPEDAELSRKSAEFSAIVPDFAQALNKAWGLEEKRQHGVSMAWFLKAKSIYPVSRYAEEGIARLSQAILPDAAAVSLPAPTNPYGNLPPPAGVVAPTSSAEAPPPVPAAVPGSNPAPQPGFASPTPAPPPSAFGNPFGTTPVVR